MRRSAPPLLDQVVTVQRMTATADGQGGFTEVWANQYPNIRAKITGRAGSEQQQAERTDAHADYLVTIRHVDAPDLTEADRIFWVDRYLNIRNAPPAQRSHYRVMGCEGGAAL